MEMFCQWSHADFLSVLSVSFFLSFFKWHFICKEKVVILKTDEEVLKKSWGVLGQRCTRISCRSLEIVAEAWAWVSEACEDRLQMGRSARGSGWEVFLWKREFVGLINLLLCCMSVETFCHFLHNLLRQSFDFYKAFSERIKTPFVSSDVMNKHTFKVNLLFLL